MDCSLVLRRRGSGADSERPDQAWIGMDGLQFGAASWESRNQDDEQFEPRCSDGALQSKAGPVLVWCPGVSGADSERSDQAWIGMDGLQFDLPRVAVAVGGEGEAAAVAALLSGGFGWGDSIMGVEKGQGIIGQDGRDDREWICSQHHDVEELDANLVWALNLLTRKGSATAKKTHL